MEIIIYAPVDGEIKSIEKCKDSMFADRMLGDGLVIIPSKNTFKGFFDMATVTMIFDTKHAYGFDVDGLQFLLHCGMDTVSLDGEGFKTNLTVGTKVTKNDELFNVDLKLLKDKNISAETPIVFEFNQLKEYQIKDLKTGMVKQGEQICTIEYINEKETTKKETKIVTDPAEFFNVSGIYERGAKDINAFVGNQANYDEVYNCMTRLRFKIKDKQLVNIDELKKISLVKGTVWNGNELQVVIGQDVFKVKDEIIKDNSNSNALKASLGSRNVKIPLGRKLLAMFSGIMVKIIPIMVGAGLIQAIIAILIQVGVMPNIVFKITAESAANDVLITQAPIGWAILFAMGKSTTYFVGIIIAVSAANYFKLEGLMGVALGIILCCPMMFYDGGPLGIGNEFILFDFGDLNTGNPMLDGISKIKINTMNTKIFVIVGAIYTAKVLDTWLKSVIPVALELMFRPFIVILVVAPLAFFGYGIVWNFVETLFGALMFYVGKIPVGIGVGIFVALWQVAVIFGLHIMLSLISTLDHFQNGGQSIYGIAGSLSVWAQVGALIGVIVVTQNSKLRKQGLGMLPAGFLGITEPILYGINLPKKRPLFSGVAAAFIAGAFANILGVTKRASSGIGVFEAIGFFSEPIYNGKGAISPIENGVYYLLACAIALGLAILFSMLSYKERVNEKTLLTKTLEKTILLAKLQLNLTIDDVKTLKNDEHQILSLFTKETKKEIIQNEKRIQKWLRVSEKINTLLEKEEIAKDKLITQGKKLIAKEKFDKASLLMHRYNALDCTETVNQLRSLKEELYKEIDFAALNNTAAKMQNDIEQILANSKYLSDDLINEVKLMIYNNLNSVQIHYGLLEVKNPNVNLNNLIDDQKSLLKKQKKENVINA
ncbi:glucose PTS transporter subunit IIA [Mesoplasma seiffertii]|uniref:glucose PTS transporter subunit IIA n=1 Tax=Mesoplasma seiffertii TaxID=28224 RepID=UPI00047BCCBD|nr:glucose PTS transporter subunit IIA [Mesoplasma seiffertii]